ncbi:MAG: GAF domain-containing protein [Elusimicrobia bacterium]|nr:GAF domain-containing protein [Candidatus Obscuribacterium magneticum]
MTKKIKKEEWKAKALDTLTEVSSAIVQDRYLEDIMERIVNMTAQMMSSNICSVMLLDEKKGELKIMSTQSLSPEYKTKPPVKVHGSLSGQAVLAKRPTLVKDVRKEPSYQFRDIAIHQGLVSLLSVPMMYKNKVLGVLNVYTPVEHEFSPDELAFTQSVANQCAAAIENTRLLSEKLFAQEALETRKAVERAKGILMKQKNLPEQDAFREIQRQSMDRRKSMKEISEAIILAYEMTEKK